MRTTRGFLAVAMVAGILLPTGSARADLRVWTTPRTEHVLRSALPGNDLTVTISAAKNEWRSFQVLLRADRTVTGVSLKAGELRGPQGAVLDVHRARLYRQHQLRLDVGTYRNDQFHPDWYPDPLIPFEHPLPRGKLEQARFTAVPFDLPAGETHGFWIDLSVPEEALPGDYHGVYGVTAEGIAAVEIPVNLTVWGFSLPQVPTLVTALGSPAAQLRAYRRQRSAGDNRPQAWAAVEAQCAQLLADHRINATPPDVMLSPVAQPDGLFQISAARVQALREFVDRYHVNAIQVPHPAVVVKDPQREQGKLRAWLSAFDRAAKELDRPQVVFYTYLKDEPNTLDDYRYVQRWGRAVREVKSVVKVLVVEQPWTEPGMDGADSAWGDLYGAVDIWCPLFSLQRPEPAARRQALGETIWTYTALCQGRPTPWWHIDFPLLNYRVPGWIAWSDRMKGLLYWGGMSYWEAVDDPWLTAPAYTGRGKIQQGGKGIVFQGEGSLVYPARAVGYEGIVPTVRLKALRDGIQDFEYLAVLERLGKRQAAEKIVHRLAESWFRWEKDPAAYDRARAELARVIMEATVKNSAPARSTLAAPLAGHAAESAPWATKDLRAGIIGTDTSHVPAFTQLFRSHPEWKIKVTAAFKAGSPDLPTSANRVEGFAKVIHDKYGVELVSSIEELLSKVDVVLLESVDGRPHLAQATPVLKAGKRLFIDKPLAASLDDVRHIVELSKTTGTPFFSSSSLRFHPDIPRLRKNPGVGKVVKVQGSSSLSKLEFHPDLFFYGIHGVEPLYAVMGTGCVSVSRKIAGGADITTGKWKDGRVGVYYGVLTKEKVPLIRIWGTEGTADSAGPEDYKDLVRAIAEFFQTGRTPVDPAETTELFEFMTAAQLSKERGGAEVPLEELRK